MILCPACIKYVQGVIYNIMSCMYEICTGYNIYTHALRKHEALTLGRCEECMTTGDSQDAVC